MRVPHFQLCHGSEVEEGGKAGGSRQPRGKGKFVRCVWGYRCRTMDVCFWENIAQRQQQQQHMPLSFNHTQFADRGLCTVPYRKKGKQYKETVEGVSENALRCIVEGYFMLASFRFKWGSLWVKYLASITLCVRVCVWLILKGGEGVDRFHFFQSVKKGLKRMQ